MKRPHLVVAGGVVLVLAIIGFRFRGHSGSGIETGTVFSPLRFLNVHSSPDYWLRVAGKRYDNVTGTAPFFLKIEEWDAVFFVTDDRRKKIAHFVFIKDGREVSVDADGFYSYNLGATEASRSWVRIDRVLGQKVVVTVKSYDESTEHEFDLAKKLWSRVERGKERD